MELGFKEVGVWKTGKVVKIAPDKGQSRKRQGDTTQWGMLVDLKIVWGQKGT